MHVICEKAASLLFPSCRLSSFRMLLRDVRFSNENATVCNVGVFPLIACLSSKFWNFLPEGNWKKKRNEMNRTTTKAMQKAYLTRNQHSTRANNNASRVRKHIWNASVQNVSCHFSLLFIFVLFFCFSHILRRAQPTTPQGQLACTYNPARSKKNHLVAFLYYLADVDSFWAPMLSSLSVAHTLSQLGSVTFVVPLRRLRVYIFIANQCT